MAELKREYVIPLRRETRNAPRWRRSKKAVSVLKDFVRKHMKTDSVLICKELNEKLWENGIKNPPGKVSVVALKTDKFGKEMTLVNLVEVGIDKQLEMYNSMMPQAAPTQVKEAQVSEKPAEDKKETEATVEEKQEAKPESKEEESKK